MGRLPIRVRLTAAFALAMLLMLGAAGLFVYLSLRADLDEGVDNGLRSRSDDAAALVERSGPGLGESGSQLVEAEESFAQILTPDGRLIDGTGGANEPALTPDEARQASRATSFHERHVPGIEAEARILARPVSADGRPFVLVVGASLDDRDETLSGVISSFAIGGPIAVLLASGLGYLVARAGLGPVEAMRRRAERISLTRAGERLPLLAAKDEVRRLGETLNEMLARLEAAFERERRFVADASHELRTPLAVVKAELEAALRRTDPHARESLVAALEETDHLAQLAEDMLLIARSGDGALPVRPEDVEVRELLDQARERFRDRDEAEGRRIVVRAPEGLRARLDPLRLRQALGNVVDNALRHGLGDVTIAASSYADGVQIDVSDEGGGFSPELAPSAFERFTRGDEARTRSGAGLGLAIVRAIAEAHGGTATIEEDGSPGALVRLRLPAPGYRAPNDAARV
jgi:two-component system OmpR family sensor kinase